MRDDKASTPRGSSTSRRGVAIGDLAGKWAFTSRKAKSTLTLPATATTIRETLVVDVPEYAKGRELRVSLRLREGTLVGEYIFLTVDGESHGDGRYVDFEVFDDGRRLLGFPSGSRTLERWELTRG